MKASLFAASPAERRLLPGASLRGPAPYLVAVMTFAMMIVAAAGLSLANTTGSVADAVEHRHVIQLPDGSPPSLAAALAAARSAEGVLTATPVPEAEMRRTLERWMGPAGLGTELPVPALIHLDLAPGADPAAIGRRIAAAVPEARLIAEEATLSPLLRSLRALQWLALTLVLLMAGATAAAVVLAARGALDTHRSTVEIMHGIGATDEQVARLFQRKIALDALAGGLSGGALAALVLLLVGLSGAGLAADLAGEPPLGLLDALLLALIPLAVMALALIVARMAVLAALRNTP